MTNKELIDILLKFPSESKVNFWIFSNLTPRRCDVPETNVMILRSPHTGEIGIMLDLPSYWENDLIESQRGSAATTLPS